MLKRVKDLTQLQVLDLRATQVRDLSAINALEKLRNLKAKGYSNIIEATRNRVDFVDQEETKEFFEKNKPDVYYSFTR